MEYMEYNTQRNYLTMREYGRHIQRMVEYPENRVGFANSIAYYMKRAYSNWHKDLVHDDGIRSELNIITNGQLEFDSTPFVKHFRPTEGRENRGGGGFGENRFKRNNNN